MEDILEVIKSRRTIRQFLPKFVSWENISRILDAGRHAPSSGNIQNWKFIVVLESGQKQELAKAAYEQYDLAMAGVLILVCAEPEKAERYYGDRGKNFYSVQNCAAAIENVLLEAHSLGLGGWWIGAFDEEIVRASCGIPEEIIPQAIIALGYPKEIPDKPPKYPLEPIVYFHRWRNRIRDPAKYMLDIASILERKVTAAKASLQEASGFIVDKVKEKAAGGTKEETGKE